MVRGYRTLTRTGRGPVAAAPDPTLSLLALVPLSHFLGWTIPDLKRSFLSAAGAPLLRQGRYTCPRLDWRRRRAMQLPQQLALHSQPSSSRMV